MTWRACCAGLVASAAITMAISAVAAAQAQEPPGPAVLELVTTDLGGLDADSDLVDEDGDTSRAVPDAPPDIGASFEGALCDSEFIAHARGLLGPTVADTPVLVYPDEYFDTLAETYGWSFSPLGIYMRGEVRIHERECRLAGSNLPVDDRDAWREDRAEAMIVHELTHALDDALGRPSVHIDFAETDIMHAQAMAQPGTELWAFCLQQMAGYEIRDRCPAENRSAVVNAMTGFDGFPVELLDETTA